METNTEHKVRNGQVVVWVGSDTKVTQQDINRLKEERTVLRKEYGVLKDKLQERRSRLTELDQQVERFGHSTSAVGLFREVSVSTSCYR